MTEQTATVGNWNLPNVLTGVRILLVPVFGFALLHEGGDSILWRCLATAVFAVAMVTDKIDGDIARSRGLVTNFGKIADPIADKAMTGMAFVGFVSSPYAAIALLCLGGFAHQTLSVTVITMSSDLFKRNEVATVAGMAGTCGNGGVLVFSLIIGALVAAIGYTPFFVCLGVLDLIGALILWTLVREPNAARRS